MAKMGNKDIAEVFAIKLALGNNGGTWATHYTEEQKQYWRKLALDMLLHARRLMENGE